MKSVKKKLLILVGLMSAFALMAAVVAADQHEEQEENGEEAAQQQQGEWGVVFLDGDFDGMAMLRSEQGGDETEVALGIRNGGGGFLGIGGADEEDIGPAAILMGTCDEPQSVVEEIGELTPLMAPQQQANGEQQQEGNGQQDQQDAEGYAVAGSVPMGLDDLLTGEYIIGVLEREEANGNGQQQQEEINLLACGVMAQESRLDAAPVTPAPVEPVEPVEPTPTPADPDATPTPMQ